MNRLGIDFVPSRPSRPGRLAGRPAGLPLGESPWSGDALRVRRGLALAPDRSAGAPFLAAARRPEQIRVIPRYVHAANSAALVHRRRSAGSSGVRYTMVRPGLALYGYVKQVVGRDAATTNSLEPVLEWRARLMRVRDVCAGAPIGYGASYVTPRAMRVGRAIGRLRGRTWTGACRIAGRFPCAGRTVRSLAKSAWISPRSISAQPPALEKATRPILLGAPPLDARSVASLNGDSAYQVLCRISNRVQRQYVTDAARR